MCRESPFHLGEGCGDLELTCSEGTIEACSHWAMTHLPAVLQSRPSLCRSGIHMATSSEPRRLLGFLQMHHTLISLLTELAFPFLWASRVTVVDAGYQVGGIMVEDALEYEGKRQVSANHSSAIVRDTR